MSTTGRTEVTASAASDIAGQLQQADLVQFIVAATGEAVAAGGLLTRALEATGTPYQLSIVPLPDDGPTSTAADLTIGVGRPAAVADIAVGLEASVIGPTHEIARELGTVSATLASAGSLLATTPRQLQVDDSDDLERRPGVAIPTSELVDGLAHSTLLHTSFSGDEAATRDVLERAGVETGTTDSLEDDAARRLASQVALAVVEDDGAAPRAASTVERFLHPIQGTVFGTVGGFADVLQAVSHTDPRLALRLVFGTADESTALEQWRTQARSVHSCLHDADRQRYEGLTILRCQADAPLETVARLELGYRSADPTVLACTDGAAVMVATADTAESVTTQLEGAARRLGGTAAGTTTRGHIHFDDQAAALVTALQEER